MTDNIKLAAVAAAAAFALNAAPANAEVITLSAGEKLVVNFELPVQPAFNNSVWIQPSAWTGNGTLTTENALFDSQGLIAKGAASDVYQYKFFSTPDSYFIQQAEPWAIPFDFSRIAGGGSGYRFELTLLSGTPGAWMNFDTKDLFVKTFGDQGEQSAYFGTVIGTSVVSVPEPASIAMFIAGLAGLAALRRRRAA